MRVNPRHAIDIGWRDLASALPPDFADASEHEAQLKAAWRGAGEPVACLSVRTAFDALLRVLAPAPGDEIVMSAVNIASMADIARAHGLVIRPVDVSPDTLAPSADAVAAALTERTRLILITHLYGARVDLAPYGHLRRPGLLLAEDAAQAWTPEFWGSRQVDVSLFSFGPIKTATALGGAVASFRDPALADAVRKVAAAYPPLTNAWFRRRVAKYAVMKLCQIPVVYGAIAELLKISGRDLEDAVGSIARGFAPGELLPQIRRRPPSLMLRLLARRLRTYRGVASRRRAAQEILQTLPAQAQLGRAVAEHSYWVAPILVDDPDGARTTLMQAGFDATRGATSLRSIAGDERAAPAADAMMRHVLYVPTPEHLNAARRAQLADAVGALTPPRS